MSSWTDFLAAQGAIFQNQETRAFGDGVALADPADGHTFMVDLSHVGLVEARGADALTFLTGQFTNDLRRLNADQSQLNGYCNAQGRLIALLRIYQHDTGFLVDVPKGLIEPLLKRLRMFVLRAQVSLEDVSERWARIGLAGTAAGGLIEQTLDIAAPQPNGVARTSTSLVLSIPGPVPRFEVVAPNDLAQRLWTSWAPTAKPSGAGAWRLLNIRSGLPEVASATSQEFIPQMLNLQAIGGVNFKKGCYPGQEIVARMQYLGKLKRRMYLGRCPDAAVPAPGDALYQGGQEPGQKAGLVVCAEASPDGGVELLAVVEMASTGDVHLKSPTGPAVTLTDPPYPLGSG